MSAEQEFIDRVTAGPSPLPIGPGDDAAVLADGWVVSVDTVVEGTHFVSETTPALVARKAVGAALSDLAAMGAEPQAILFAVQLPPGIDAGALADALREAAAVFDVPVAGGDTVAAPPGALSVSVTVAGRCRGEVWTRAGARPGDRLLVSGPLGGAQTGRHLRARPRFDIVSDLREGGTEVHAAMDLSDGLGVDLPRLCAASAVGARVEAARLPIHPDARGARDTTVAALFDGEDYELLLAVPHEADLARCPELVEIGSVLDEAGGLTLVQDGACRAWPRGGFSHDF